MSAFTPAGPDRYLHQRRGLQKLLAKRGVAALLFDPGLGKTATLLDYASILALKLPPKVGPAVLGSPEIREARVLVVAPMAAVDTWVTQAEKWVHPDVNYWAEAVGGSILDRAEALAARGGAPGTAEMIKRKLKRYELGPDAPTQVKLRALRAAAKVMGQVGEVDARYVAALVRKVHLPREVVVKELQRAIDRELRRRGPRSLHAEKALAWAARGDGGSWPLTREHGPDGLGNEKPRLVLLSLNFDTFSSRQAHGNGTIADVVLDAVKRFQPDLVAIDESHKIKGATSNVSRLMNRVGMVVPRRAILTGTVMPHSPLDVFAQWRFLEPHAFGTLQLDGSRTRATYDGFRDRFAVMGGYLGREVTGFRHLEEMHAIMAEHAVVARKADALDLPPVTPVTVPVNLNAAEQRAYDEMKKSLAVQLGSSVMQVASVGNRLAQLMRLRQITSGHLPDDMGVLHELGTSKVDTIRSIVQDQLTGEDRIVIFSVFTHEIAALTRSLAASEKGAVIMTITGDTPNEERIAMRKRFGSNEKVRIILIAQVVTISLAVNELVTAANVIFGSLSTKRDDLIQGIDRLNRIGQTRPVTVWYTIAPKTVDEVILRSHNDRTDLEAAMLKHIFDEDSSHAVAM